MVVSLAQKPAGQTSDEHYRSPKYKGLCLNALHDMDVLAGARAHMHFLSLFHLHGEISLFGADGLYLAFILLCFYLFLFLQDSVLMALVVLVPYPVLALNFWQSPCFNLTSAGIVRAHHCLWLRTPVL